MTTRIDDIKLPKAIRTRSVDLRLLLITVITVAVALTFWVGSRVPNLNDKAMMAGDSGIAALGFDQVFAASPDDTLLIEVAKTTINWMDTNKRGMTFGVLFAACLMSLLALFERRSFRSSYGNVFLGTLIGTPLGVCVNCAAPIAKGLHAAGSRLETTLATMISSPTLNVIVLTMIFALLPWYLVATKLVLTLALIFIFIPLACRVLFTEEALNELSPVPNGEYQACELPLGTAQSSGYRNEWLPAFNWLLQVLPKNLWHIVRTTVPLMVLAGFLGSLLIVVVPWDSLTSMLPSLQVGPLQIITAMAALAIFGAFLPVPITFDIVIVVVLLEAGMPEKYAAVLLFTLGVFSVYSFQIVWQYVSKKAAVAVFLGVSGLGIVSGVAAHYLGSWDEQRQYKMLYAELKNNAPTNLPAAKVAPSVPLAEIDLLPRGSEPVQEATANVTLTSQPVRQHGDTKQSRDEFTAINGDALGIGDVAPFSVLKQLPPMYWGRSIATGDIHGDGWPDVLMSADITAGGGLALYANVGGRRFQKQALAVPGLGDLNVANASLVDMNNDGWLDIFFATYRQGNYILYNDRGDFAGAPLARLPDNNEVVSAAVSFGDIDQDGDLDIAIGNWSLGYLYNAVPGSPLRSRDYLLVQEDGNFEVRLLDEFPGETQSVLLSDFDGDQALDLIIGNDFARSDLYYLGDGLGNFEEIGATSGKITRTAWSTMSAHTADIDNDLVPEVFLGQITPGEGAGFARSMIPSTESCAVLPAGAWHGDCGTLLSLNESLDVSHKKLDVRVCSSIEDRRMREDCLALHVLWAARARKNAALCELIPAHRPDVAAICDDMFAEHVVISPEAAAEALPETGNNNLLLHRTQVGFEDRAESAGLAQSGWTWNAKFADLDNDGWQDIYIANGHFPSQRRESNFFFHNQKNGVFVEATARFGLSERRATGAYSYVDFDGDCDLDIIAVPITGMIRVFRNERNSVNCIQIKLEDNLGNRSGIGSKVLIRYGAAAGKRQMREIQAGGGFLSADPAVAHFGLGDHTSVQEVEVVWSTGEHTLLSGPFKAGALYTISRGDSGRTR